MNIIDHSVQGQKIAQVVSDNVLIHHLQEALDLLGDLYYQGYDQIILQKKNMTPEFFELKNGLAGDILQKFSNYRIRLAIVGDFSVYTGKSIRAFITESNRGRHINFVDTVDDALDILSSK